MFKKVNNCKLKSHQWCLTHKRQCALVGAGPDYNCAGLPCWDYSFAGKRLQEEGETKRVFIAYAAYHCSQRTPLLVIENVKGLRIEMIKWLFCLHYDIHILVCGVEDQGHDGASRDRLWIILSHKERTKQLFDPAELYRMVCKSIRTYVCTKPADYSIAPPVEIKNEAMHLATDNYRTLLTGRELQCLDDAEEEYRKIYQQSPEQDPDLVIYLGDTFCVRKTWSGTSRRIPTFRAGGGLMWWYAQNRWMTNRERLSSLAFPVTSEVASSMNVPQLPIRDHSRASAISGNSMCFATAAIVQLVALICFQQTC
ncbi:unnamed protein product [Cladocopium goreaui]|uniref:Uncharacterized protein n=1 Tax=Cladocopium goreaui TaxID=2562237 RepID=A0A9P1GPB0_9DINO|nr:unnamed protein product [Cladocopium goreaui]